MRHCFVLRCSVQIDSLILQSFSDRIPAEVMYVQIRDSRVQQVLLWVWVNAVRYALYLSCFVISRRNMVTSRLATGYCKAIHIVQATAV